MAYQALYRTWRSQRFDEIVGQQAITQTLKNAIAQHKTSHAYLFTGPRGTGKTSAAKIFAKAVNCQNSSDGEPCNQCANCLGITEGRLNDVIEIDAASNNGVDEIRELRDKVNYAPTQADFKVYIIDEVHMLSTGAFNALLKTLEEPPKNVIFILATTEPHKIPLTIISRTQRFDFKRINSKDIVQHMEHILQVQKFGYEEAALYTIARTAEGGMRDALSILDQALSFSTGDLTLTDAVQVTGSLTAERMDHYLQACLNGEVQAALTLLEELLDEGKEGSRLLEDLLLYCRDLLLFQQAPDLLIDQGAALSADFKQLAKELEPEHIYHYIQTLNETQNEIRFTTHPNVYLEVATVKLAHFVKPANSSRQDNNRHLPEDGMSDALAANETIQQLAAKVQQLEQQVEQLKQSGQAAVDAHSSVDGTKKRGNGSKGNQKKAGSYRVPTEQVYTILQEATKDHLLQVKNVWADLLQMLTVTQRAMMKASDPVAAGPSGMVIAFDYEIVCQRASQDGELCHAVQQSLQKLIQYAPQLVCIPLDSWGGLRAEYLNQHQEAKHSTASLADTDQGELELLPANDQDTDGALVSKAQDLFGADFVQVVDD